MEGPSPIMGAGLSRSSPPFVFGDDRNQFRDPFPFTATARITVLHHSRKSRRAHPAPLRDRCGCSPRRRPIPRPPNSPLITFMA